MFKKLWFLFLLSAVALGAAYAEEPFWNTNQVLMKELDQDVNSSRVFELHTDSAATNTVAITATACYTIAASTHVYTRMIRSEKANAGTIKYSLSTSTVSIQSNYVPLYPGESKVFDVYQGQVNIMGNTGDASQNLDIEIIWKD
ncbi:MAG: hypothetical protein WC479_11435 [Candidatus Izemoplasmatales bacterium]